MLGGSSDGNPIAWVGDINGDSQKTVKCPSSYEWTKEYVSKADSGRSESGLMNVNYITAKVKLKLSWQNLTGAEAKSVLSAFSRFNSSDSDTAYLKVNYLDALSNSYETKTFYVGERSAPCYNTNVGLWENVSFNLIER